jgi:hypothetical protein
MLCCSLVVACNITEHEEVYHCADELSISVYKQACCILAQSRQRYAESTDRAVEMQAYLG